MTTDKNDSPSALLRRLVCLGTAALLAACNGSDKTAPAGSAASAPASQATGSDEHKGGELKLTSEEAQRAGLKVEVLGRQAIGGSITVTATIHPNQDRIARVAPRVEGRVLRVASNLGDVVRQGQALAVLDSLAIGEAQSALLQAQSAHRVTQADFERAQALSADEIIPKREFLRVKAELEKSTTELRAAGDKLRLLGGTQGQGRPDATFALLAPMSGTVTEKKATVGQLSTPSEPLFTLADLSTLWIEADLTEDAIAKVRVGATATVTVTTYPGERFVGRVTYVASILNKESRTVPARIEVANQDGRLKPGMFASATIATGGPAREELSVPDAAVLLLQGQPTVFVQEGDGFEARPIEPGDKIAGRTIVKSGIEAGEKVVTSGGYALKARLLKSQISDEH
jgi:cobalt-zinc-cadmium efflux system membrane fusion protein